MPDVPSREDVEIAYATKRKAETLVEKLAREISWLQRENIELRDKVSELEAANKRQEKILRAKV